MGSLSLNIFRVYIILLGIWTGSGIHDTLSTHFAWYADPVAWEARPAWQGMVNPWPFSTVLLLVATLAAAVAIWRYRGPGRRSGAISVGGCVVILVATLAWFVPQLSLMSGGTLSDPDLISHARTWIAFNAVRLVALVGLSWMALVALGRLTRTT